MSWQGWDRKVPNPRREPTPEPAPPAFHKPKSRKARKLWAVQIRGTAGLGLKFFPEWATLRRYRTQGDAETALAAYERGESGRWSKAGYLPRETEYRLTGPDGEPLSPDDSVTGAPHD